MSSQMKSYWRCTLLAFLLHCAGAARSEHLELAIERVHQRGSQLCWAAVSEMAINHLQSTTPAVKQGQLAAYRLWQKLTPEDIAVANHDPDFTAEVEACRVVPSAACDDRGEPLLLGLDFDSSATEPLKRIKLVTQLSGDRPVILKWHFAQQSSTRPVFGHAVIVIGFDTSTDEFLIWDPWPFDQQATSTVGNRAKWLSYAEYKQPHLVMGAGVSHVSEVFNLRRPASVPIDLRVVADVEPTMLRTPSSIGLRPVEISPVRPTRFRAALAATAPLAKNAKALNRKPAIRGRAPEVSARTAGDPLPMIVLSPDDLVPRQIDVGRLLVPMTSAVLYPVFADGQVVDAYLATIGSRGWQERGYASTEVTRRIAEQRTRMARGAEDLYVVAVPAWGTFFLAQGFGATAQLTPIATTSFSEAGRTLPASTLLERMAIELQPRETRPQDPIPVRPL